MIQLGLRLHDAPKLPFQQVLPHVREQGFSCIHMALRKSMPEYPADPSALTPGYAGWIRRNCQSNGLDIAVLGNYLNLAHPDAQALKTIQEAYYAHIRFAAYLGGGVLVGTETGAPNPEYRTTPECRTDEALKSFIENLTPVVRQAEQWGVTVAIEPVIRHIVYNPARCRTVLDEIGSPNLKVLFDPVNLIDETNVNAREEVFAEAMSVLGPDIVMVHLKDFVFDDSGRMKAVGAGRGEMDYTQILRYLKREKPWIYATLENTTPDNAVACREYLEDVYQRV